MINRFILFLILTISIFGCKEEEKDKSYGGLTPEDVLSIEESSIFSYESIIYEGKFKGEYFDQIIELELDNDGDFTILYKNNKIKGEWYKKDDGSLMEFDSKKKLPFQFLKWSDNSTIMILNSDGTADDEGGNYLTRIEK
ncbi:hypothetical protein [Faecalibacter bovis]|uniref:Copper resistance protein NlpE n=1 Tax=Faecalibacter bovis TaxID=2898187 RepID=A0ABX7XBV2_9FLAO|nr:hypothetical protein [Faecalibacter bovis]MBS7333951.1 hypothetical protein [Weeksellaceae bacterium]QTV05310.1 hypothetical protein J9309_11065 [Faecalibacter bovis]